MKTIDKINFKDIDTEIFQKQYKTALQLQSNYNVTINTMPIVRMSKFMEVF